MRTFSAHTTVKHAALNAIASYYQQLMCSVFFYLLQYLIAAIKPIQKKNVTRIIQSWTQHTHLCSSYFNHCYKSIKSVNPSSSACSTRHPTAKHPQNLPIPTPGRLKSQLETSKILSHPLCKEHISKCWNQTMHPATGECIDLMTKHHSA